MKQLKQILSAFEIRVDENWNEVEKPEKFDKKYDSFLLKYDSFLLSDPPIQKYSFEDDLKQYNAATPVIKLPDWKELWDHTGKQELSETETIAVMDELFVIMIEPPKLEDFVPAKDGKVLEEPYFSGAIGDEQYYGAEMDEYATAKANVKFFGWRVVIDGNKLVAIRNSENKIYFYKNGTVSFEGRFRNTYDDLNRECQLYLIK